VEKRRNEPYKMASAKPGNARRRKLGVSKKTGRGPPYGKRGGHRGENKGS